MWDRRVCGAVHVTVQVTLLKGEESRLVFVYPDPTNMTTGLYVSVVRMSYEEFSTCETALPVVLPYTALHRVLDSPVPLVCKAPSGRPSARLLRLRGGLCQHLDVVAEDAD